MPAAIVTQPKKTKSRGRRAIQSITRIAAVLGVFYMALLCYLYWNQRDLIFPGSIAANKRNVQMTDPPSGDELLRLPTPSGQIAALYGPALLPSGRPASDNASRPTVLYFYGNGGSIAGSMAQIRRFQKLGVNVITPDYPGFGMSAGAASEQGCYDAAEAAYRYAMARPHVAPAKLIFAGWSLGSAVAIDLASKHHCAGLVTFSAFTSMAEMANSQYPIVPLPLVRLILKHKFLSEEKVRQITCPVLIGHSRSDTFVPYAMADRLAAAAAGRAARLTTVGSDHGDFFRHDSPQIFDAVGKFIHQSIH